MAEQKMCSDQAKRLFNEFKSASAWHLEASGFMSRYDSSQGVCYAEMDRMNDLVVGKALRTELTFTVVDAFSNAAYAGYLDYHDTVRDGANEEKPARCWVKPPSQSKLYCSSMFEFQDLVEKDFDIDLGL